MVFTTNITPVTTNTTLSLKDDVILVDATAGSITITLPNILSDGIHYKIKRTDNISANTVTVQGSIGQLIDGNLSTIILPSSIFEVHSYSLAWYIIGNSSIIRSDQKAMFTAAFIQNNGTPNVSYSGNLASQIVCSFYYPGSLNEAIYRLTFVLGTSGGSPIGTAQIRNINNGTLIGSVTFTGLTLLPSIWTTTTITNLPTAPSILEYRVQFPGNNNKLDVYSLTIQ